jgi:hypothetical protein
VAEARPGRINSGESVVQRQGHPCPRLTGTADMTSVVRSRAPKPGPTKPARKSVFLHLEAVDTPKRAAQVFCCCDPRALPRAQSARIEQPSQLATKNGEKNGAVKQERHSRWR